MTSPCCRQLNVHERGIGSPYSAQGSESAPSTSDPAPIAYVTAGKSMMLRCTIVNVFHALEKELIFALQR